MFFIEPEIIDETNDDFGIAHLHSKIMISLKYQNCTIQRIHLWSGKEAFLSSLHDYHTALHIFHSEKDAFVMSNT